MQNKHGIWELRQMQSLPLESKIAMTKHRIQTWVDEFGIDGVYVSFSGGKDSAVLLDIIRQDYPDALAVFVDTGLEYPEIRTFVKGFENVIWLRPKINFRQVINQYGYPFISKEVSNCVEGARKYLRFVEGQKWDSEKQRIPYANCMADLLGIDRRIDKKNKQYQNLQSGVIPKGSLIRLKRLNGKLRDKNGNYSQFNQEKYKFFLDAPFEISCKCCDIMKKSPVHEYARKTGRMPITAQMAAESRLRMNKWL